MSIAWRYRTYQVIRTTNLRRSGVASLEPPGAIRLAPPSAPRASPSARPAVAATANGLGGAAGIGRREARDSSNRAPGSIARRNAPRAGRVGVPVRWPPAEGPQSHRPRRSCATRRPTPRRSCMRSPSARRASPSARRRSRRRTAGGGRRNGARASGAGGALCDGSAAVPCFVSAKDAPQLSAFVAQPVRLLLGRLQFRTSLEAKVGYEGVVLRCSCGVPVRQLNPLWADHPR